MSITYSECVFLAIGIQHAMRMCYVVIIDGLSVSTVFVHIISQTQKVCRSSCKVPVILVGF